MNRKPGDTWQLLLANRLVSGEAPQINTLESPWFVRLMLGIAGWIAAIFILAFIASGLSWVMDSDTAKMAIALAMMAAAWLLLWKMGKTDFAAQFALAISFAGQALFALGLFDLWDMHEPGPTPWVVVASLQAVLALVMPNAIHRLWSAFAATVTFYLALQAGYLASLAVGLLLALASWAWLNEFRWPARARVFRLLSYGVVLGLVAVELATGIFGWFFGMARQSEDMQTLPAWSGQLFTGAVLVWVCWELLERKLSVLLLAAAALTLVSIKAPGIATGVCIVLLGHAHGNRLLTGLGLAALLAYISAYYYNMETTLLVKSQVLAVTGTLILVLRWAFVQWLARGKEASHD